MTCFACFSNFPYLGRIRPGREGVAAVGPARAVVAAPAGGGVVELGARPVVTELPGVMSRERNYFWVSQEKKSRKVKNSTETLK